MDQQGLVERARRGDRQAFAELIRASGARLDATARLILRDPERGPTSRTHVVAADGSQDRVLDSASGSLYDRPSSWSNDSTRLVLYSAYEDDGDERVAVFALDSVTPSVELDCRAVGLAVCPEHWEWSPDDTQLFSAVEDESGAIRYLKADPTTGIVTEAPWSGTGDASWQPVVLPS